MPQIRVEEAAALEVGLGDLLGRRVARDAEQLVVRQPVDAPVGVPDQLGVARRPVARGSAATSTFRPWKPPRPLAGRSAPSCFHSTMPQETRRVEDLGRRHPRGAGDLQQRVHVQDAVDPRQEVGLLGSQRQVLVARHRIAWRGSERGGRRRAARGRSSVSGSRRMPSTMIAAVESDSATSGSSTPAEAWNLYSPVSHAKVEKTISSTSRRISASSTVRDTRPRSTRIFPSRARPCLATVSSAQLRSVSVIQPRRLRNAPIRWPSREDVAVRSSPFSKKRCRVSSPWTRVRVPFSRSRKILRRTCGRGVSARDPRKPAGAAWGGHRVASAMGRVQGSRKRAAQRTRSTTTGRLRGREEEGRAPRHERAPRRLPGRIAAPEHAETGPAARSGVVRSHIVPAGRSYFQASASDGTSQTSSSWIVNAALGGRRPRCAVAFGAVQPLLARGRAGAAPAGAGPVGKPASGRRPRARRRRQRGAAWAPGAGPSPTAAGEGRRCRRNRRSRSAVGLAPSRAAERAHGRGVGGGPGSPVEIGGSSRQRAGRVADERSRWSAGRSPPDGRRPVDDPERAESKARDAPPRARRAPSTVSSGRTESARTASLEVRRRPAASALASARAQRLVPRDDRRRSRRDPASTESARGFDLGRLDRLRSATSAGRRRLVRCSMSDARLRLLGVRDPLRTRLEPLPRPLGAGFRDRLAHGAAAAAGAPRRAYSGCTSPSVTSAASSFSTANGRPVPRRRSRPRSTRPSIRRTTRLGVGVRPKRRELRVEVARRGERHVGAARGGGATRPRSRERRKSSRMQARDRQPELSRARGAGADERVVAVEPGQRGPRGPRRPGSSRPSATRAWSGRPAWSAASARSAPSGGRRAARASAASSLPARTRIAAVSKRGSEDETRDDLPGGEVEAGRRARTGRTAACRSRPPARASTRAASMSVAPDVALALERGSHADRALRSAPDTSATGAGRVAGPDRRLDLARVGGREPDTEPKRRSRRRARVGPMPGISRQARLPHALRRGGRGAA